MLRSRKGRKREEMRGVSLVFPKPKDIKHEPVAVRVYPDGREVCNLLCKAGVYEYKRRIFQMWARQNERCCICHLPLQLDKATFEHQDGRGMDGAHRDDRIEKNGHLYNGAAHWWCNRDKGSQRMTYNG